MKSKASDLFAQYITDQASPQEVADKLRVTRACLYLWRAGHSVPQHSNRLAIQELTGIRPCDWFEPGSSDSQ